jgi:arylsulfatase A-like enzyme
LSARSKNRRRPRRLRRLAIRGSRESRLVVLALSLVAAVASLAEVATHGSAAAAAGADEQTASPPPAADTVAMAQPAAPRLVVVYATCSLNKSYLAPYDPSVDYTPNLARFAKDGKTFEHHYTEAAQSGTAYASLFTGSQVDQHKIHFHPRHLDEKLDTLTEVFSRGGFDVHTWLAHLMASANLGFAQSVPEANQHRKLLTAADPAFEQVLERLKADPKAKALVVTTFTVTHGPYEGLDLYAFCERHPARCGPLQDEPTFLDDRRNYWTRNRALSFDYENEIRRLGLDETQRKRMSAAVDLIYQVGVERLDGLFGAVLDAIAAAGLEDETLVVFTSDHGESLDRAGEPFKWTHGFQLTLDELEVALLMRGPGIPAGRYAGVTRSIDVLPTIATMSGLPVPPLNATAPSHDTIGRDLGAAVRGQGPPPDLTAFFHTGLIAPSFWSRFKDFQTLTRYFPEPSPQFTWVGSRSGDSMVQLRRLPGKKFAPSVFDAGRDPSFEKDLYDVTNAEHIAEAMKLARYRTALIESFATAWKGMTPPDAEKRLRALGYIE